MSDAAITSIVTGLVTTVTILASSFALWLKVRYGVEEAKEAARDAANKATRVESKIDDNTEITAKIEKQTNGTLDHAREQNMTNTARIAALEREAIVLKASIDGLAKNLDSTRHEIRGHLQAIANNLHILAVARGGTIDVPAVLPEPLTPSKGA